ncbi:MAG: hypothetical protein B7X46_12705 [Thiomonas sp. 15-66-11]|jgi:hypothetical protein|nr:MAG: hypothetical protein B7X46_12705 [Thiomonas sp. 15-66-11]
MRFHLRHVLASCAVGAIGAVFGQAALAALGGPLSSAKADGSPIAPPLALVAQSQPPSQTNAVTQQTVVTVFGVMVTEYASGGTVFAVRWSGRTHPDLRQLLGAFFPNLHEALSKNPPRFGQPMRVNTSELVVHESGHMGAFEGIAWVPVLVPAGFSLAAIGG